MPHPWQQRRERRHRFHPQTRRSGAVGGEQVARRDIRGHHRPAGHAPASGHRRAGMGGGDRPGRARSHQRRRGRQAHPPDGHGVHHLHLGNRRNAEGGDAPPRRDPPQLRRRGGGSRGVGPRRRGFSLVPAAVSCLRAHRRAVLSNLDRRSDLLRRRIGPACRQPHRGAADDHDRGSAPVRGPPSADHPRRPQGRRNQGVAVRSGSRERHSALSREPRARLAAHRPRAGPSRPRQRSRPVRRTSQGPGVRRRPAQSADRSVLHRAGLVCRPGLRPDRGRAADLRQPSQQGENRYRRAVGKEHRGASRRRWRDPVSRRIGHAGLLAQRQGHPRDHPRRLALHRRYRRDGRRRLHPDHRPEKGYHRQFGR